MNGPLVACTASGFLQILGGQHFPFHHLFFKQISISISLPREPRSVLLPILWTPLFLFCSCVCSFFNFCSLWSYIVKTEVRIGYCFTHAHFNQSILPSSRKISSCKGHRGSHIQKRVSLMFIYWEGWHLWKEHRDYYFQSKKSNSRIR